MNLHGMIVSHIAETDKCNTTILFMDKQGKGVVVYLRVDVT